MEKHYDLSYTELLSQFDSCRLDPEIFSHEANLRLAYINLSMNEPKVAVKKIQTQIKTYVAYHGAEDKYHTTLTIAACKAVQHFMGKSSSNSFSEFISEFPRLKHNFKDLLAAHYSLDIINSTLARSEYLVPDLLPFN